MRTKVARTKKPAKGLFHHKGSGQWAAKIGGKLKYFGSIRKDPNGQAALTRYSDTLAGRAPQRHDGLSVVQLADAFLVAKNRKVESGELSARTMNGYSYVCDRVVKVLGAQRHVAGLRPSDFDAIRADLASTHGPVRLGNEITYVKMMFQYAYDAELIDKPIRFGPDFKKPTRLVLRRHRQQMGERLFSAAEIHAMLDKAGAQLRAMMLLGINCGLGNNDCALLPMSAIDLEKGWLDFPRPKTAMPRRCPLWPETVKAIKAAMAKRPSPKDAANDDRLFVTKAGFNWEPKAAGGDSPISKEVAKLLKSLGIQRRGTGFYALRHTFETIGGASRDQVAVDAIMGHAPDAKDMSAVYRERIEDDRLLTVTEHVRRWLYKK